MSTATLLAIGSALLHATWNLSVKTSADRDLSLIGQFAAGGVLGTIGLVVVGTPGAAAVPFLVGSAAVHVVYAAGLTGAYDSGDFSLVYPLARAGGAMIAAIGGVVLLGDHVTVWAWLAIAMVAVGLMAAVGPQPSPRSLMWCALTAATIGAYTVIDGRGSRGATSGESYGFAIIAATSIGVVSSGIVRGRGRELAADLRASWPRHLGGGACSTAAYVLVLIAVRSAPIAQVAMLRESSVVIGAFAGWVLLKEHLGGRRLAASCVMVTGLVGLVLAGST